MRPRIAAVVVPIAAAVAVSGALVACGSSSNSAPTPNRTTSTSLALSRPGPDGTVVVIVQDNVFTPHRIRVPAGTTVRWFNQGFSPHRIAPSDPNQDFHGLGGVGFGVPADRFHERDDYRFTFTTPGTYDYYCSIHGLSHSRMWAVVEVTPG